ncbi:hypothetical protein LTR85_009217 [Meristemomyces frigidus]|nr:hypothetical protein LTR85_009217 [Meristemomyces frigidus]
MPCTFDVTGFFDQEKYADVTVKFGTQERKCHKMILCSKSEYFDDLCGPGKSFAESGQPVVELKEDGEEAVEAMLRWLYTFDYEEHTGATEPRKANTLGFHLDVCVVADKYLLSALKDEAIKRLQTLLEAATEDKLVGFMEHVYYANEALPEAVSHMVDEVRDSRLLALMDNPSFCGMMRNDAELGMTVAQQLKARLGVMGGLVEKRYSKCSCKRVEVDDKIVTGTTYVCGARRCGLQLAVKRCWVERD